MKKIAIFLLIVLGFSFKHPFYLSVTDLKYKSQEKVIQGSIKLFVNDLEDALRKIEHQSLDLINVKDTIKTNQFLNNYLKKRLKIKVNQTFVEYNLIGFEKEEEAIWLYVEFKNCPSPKSVEIENSLLYDFIKTQSNIVHFDVDGTKKSSKVNYPEKWLFFEF